MNVHKKIDSAEAAVYLPVALSKLRELAKLSHPVQQTLQFGDVTCRLSHYPHSGQQYVHLYGGGALRYEFFTSDAISFDGGYGTPPYVGGYNESYVCGHSTRVMMGRNTTLPKAMTSWTSLGGALYLHPTSSYPTDAPAWIGRSSYNNQKVAFHQAYTTSPSGTVQYTTTPAAGQHMIAHNTIPTGTSSVNINPGTLGGDVGWDVRQPVYRAGKRVAKLQPLLSPPYWWRRGTVIVASDANGGQHPITVVTDAMSNFYFFRTALEDEYTLGTELYADRYVPAWNFKKVTAESFLPSWVEKPTVDTMRPYAQEAAYFYGYPLNTTGFLFGFPTTPPAPYILATESMPGGDTWAGSDIDNTVQNCEYLWEFSSDGRMAAAIVHEDKGAAEYRTPKADEDPENPVSRPIKVMRWGYTDLWVLSATEIEKSDYFAGHGRLHDIRTRVRGLVKVSIDVQITGDGPTDFTAVVSLEQEIKDRQFIDIAFASKHPKLVGKGVNENDLLASEIEIYHQGANSYDWRGVRYNLFAVHNISTTTNILRWRMDAFLNTVAYVPNVAVLDFGNLEEVYAYGTTTLVSPYGKLPIPEYRYDFNARYHRLIEDSLEWYVGSWSENGVYAADLKSLAFITGTHGYSYTASRGLQLFMYGDEIASSGTETSAKLTAFPEVTSMHKLPISPTREELAAAGKETLEPYDFFAAYMQAHSLTAPAQATHLLAVHPKGHYSAYMHAWAGDNTMEVEPVIDIIAYCTTAENGDVVYNSTTHRDAFNEAFKQNRTYSQYSYGAEFGVGMFATAGMWV